MYIYIYIYFAAKRFVVHPTCHVRTPWLPSRLPGRLVGSWWTPWLCLALAVSAWLCPATSEEFAASAATLPHDNPLVQTSPRIQEF